MSSQNEIILEVCTILAKQGNLKVTVKESVKGAAIVGFGTLLGGLLGPGLLVGAAVGSAAAMYAGKNFKSVVQVIREDLTASQRKQLAMYVGSLLTGINITNAGAVVAAISASSALKSEVVKGIYEFCRSQVQMQMDARR